MFHLSRKAFHTQVKAKPKNIKDTEEQVVTGGRETFKGSKQEEVVKEATREEKGCSNNMPRFLYQGDQMAMGEIREEGTCICTQKEAHTYSFLN